MSCLVRSPAATWRRLPESVVLALPGAEHPLVLNSTGALVWDVLGAATTGSDVAAHVARVCRASPAEVHSTVAALLEELLGLGVICEVGAT